MPSMELLGKVSSNHLIDSLSGFLEQAKMTLIGRDTAPRGMINACLANGILVRPSMLEAYGCTRFESLEHTV